MKTKICNRCKIEKSINKYSKKLSNKCGIRGICKDCCNLISKEDYQKNKEIVLERCRNYYKTHKKQKQEYNKKNLKRTNKYWQNKFNNDVNYQLAKKLRNRIRRALESNFKYGDTIKLLGCSVKFLRKYLEKQFKDGMSWSNYGKWHIDHIRPCAKFDLTKPSEQRKCFNYKNLQPLWASENCSKQDKY